MNEINKLLKAARFAAKKHSNQIRKGSDAEPYINHPLEVADLLADVGKVSDIDLLVAAILHDTIEDTETTKDEIAELFGKNVAEIVAEVTDDKSLPKAERKQLQIEHAPHISTAAKQLKLADKISNIADVMNNPPTDWSPDRRREYIEWGQNVAAGLRGANRMLEEYFDALAGKARQKISD